MNRRDEAELIAHLGAVNEALRQRVTELEAQLMAANVALTRVHVCDGGQ